MSSGGRYYLATTTFRSGDRVTYHTGTGVISDKGSMLDVDESVEIIIQEPPNLIWRNIDQVTLISRKQIRRSYPGSAHG